MEEKTPVGSNAPIEESTEKKTSPAGSSSASPGPCGEQLAFGGANRRECWCGRSSID